VRPHRSRGHLPALGLRTRLAIALGLTSVATLVAATLTMAPLLTQRLEAERLSDLRGLARTVRPQLVALPDADLRPHSKALLRITTQMQRRTGGRIAIYDFAGHELAEMPATGPEPAIANFAAQGRRALRAPDGVSSGKQGRVAFAVTVAQEGNGHLMLVIAKRLDDTRAAAGVVRRVLPLGLAAGVIVGAVLALLLSGSVLRRLARLHDDARALRDEGLRHEISVSGVDEVAVVAQALEEMRTRLVEEEASRQAFVATASHELRTPLASLQATLELLREEVLDGRGGPDGAAARTDTALRQTHRLVGLATDLLDLSRVDAEAALHPEPLELGELARTVAPEFAAALQAAGRRLEVEGGPALAMADPAATARVLRILLDNACNYGDGTVTVTVRATPQEVALQVADEGPGLSPDERDHVFLRFARGAAAPGTPGAGLGLAIARGLAHAQGGELEAAGGAGGAVFAMTLPPWRGIA
jgi:signal transduction histidine kinase